MALINKLLAYDYSVVADATNLGGWEDTLREIASWHDAQVKVEFLDTPLQECIKRDHERPSEERVGARVIRHMYNDFLRKE